MMQTEEVLTEDDLKHYEAEIEAMNLILNSIPNEMYNSVDASTTAKAMKKIEEQEILFDKMSRQLVEMNNNVLRLQEKIIEKETWNLELEGCVSNKDVEIEKCLERLNECFENPGYFEKAKDLRPSLYDEKVIGLGYTPMFLIHPDEALEIKKFKRARENKIEFAYDYGNLNASYVNEKINFSMLH
nr:hypothetical protein [Tanacetum cinerariifolium]